ncbi:MAG: hypothetical protein ACOC3C_07780 [Candidatus Thorarchaeota archaeon]
MIKKVKLIKSDKFGVDMKALYDFTDQKGGAKGWIEFWCEFDGRDMEIDPERMRRWNKWVEKAADLLMAGEGGWEKIYNEEYRKHHQS